MMASSRSVPPASASPLHEAVWQVGWFLCSGSRAMARPIAASGTAVRHAWPIDAGHGSPLVRQRRRDGVLLGSRQDPIGSCWRCTRQQRGRRRFARQSEGWHRNASICRCGFRTAREVGTARFPDGSGGLSSALIGVSAALATPCRKLSPWQDTTVTTASADRHSGFPSV